MIHLPFVTYFFNQQESCWVIKYFSHLREAVYRPPDIGVAPAVAAAVVPVTPAAADCAAFCFSIVQSNV